MYIPWGHWRVTVPPNSTSICPPLYGLCEAIGISCSPGSEVTSTESSIN